MCSSTDFEMFNDFGEKKNQNLNQTPKNQKDFFGNNSTIVHVFRNLPHFHAQQLPPHGQILPQPTFPEL